MPSVPPMIYIRPFQTVVPKLLRATLLNIDFRNEIFDHSQIIFYGYIGVSKVH